MELTEREEMKALVAADFNGLPREALVATIHYLAAKVLDLLALQSDNYAGR
ncbi:MAG TPA: hypothetical protein VFI41_04620 [Gemmatimonadales bacterium]|nr:hypothetical protein [Gemmatimonadales bacterium]